MWPANWATTRPGGRAAQPAGRHCLGVSMPSRETVGGGGQKAEQTAGRRRQPLLRSLRLPRSTTADRSPLLGNSLSFGSLSGSPSPVLSLRGNAETEGSTVPSYPLFRREILRSTRFRVSWSRPYRRLSVVLGGGDVVLLMPCLGAAR
jgi:hypothetical protein